MARFPQRKLSHRKLKRQLFIFMLTIFGVSVAMGFVLGLASHTHAVTFTSWDTGIKVSKPVQISSYVSFRPSANE